MACSELLREGSRMVIFLAVVVVTVVRYWILGCFDSLQELRELSEDEDRQTDIVRQLPEIMQLMATRADLCGGNEELASRCNHKAWISCILWVPLAFLGLDITSQFLKYILVRGWNSLAREHCWEETGAHIAHKNHFNLLPLFTYDSTIQFNESWI